MSRIVILLGSPRKDGNTEKLAHAFTKGAEDAGHQVKTFSIIDTKVSGCLACDYCKRNDGKCVQKDDMQNVYDALYQADTIVFASPVYYFGFSAQVKAIIDRFYATTEKPFPIASAALLVTLEGEPETDAAATVANYRSIIDYLKWEDKGMVVVGGVWGKEDIVGNPALVEAESLGKKM